MLRRSLSNRATAFLLLIFSPVKFNVRWRNAEALERGQGRVVFFAARQREPLTPGRGQYTQKWLWAQHFSAHSLKTKTSLCKQD